jgi:hypothetical protein
MEAFWLGVASGIGVIRDLWRRDEAFFKWLDNTKNPTTKYVALPELTRMKLEGIVEEYRYASDCECLNCRKAHLYAKGEFEELDKLYKLEELDKQDEPL